MTQNETTRKELQDRPDNDYKFRTTPEALDKVLDIEIEIPENTTHVQVYKYNAYMMDRNTELSTIKLYSTEEEIQDDFDRFRKECKEAEEEVE